MTKTTPQVLQKVGKRTAEKMIIQKIGKWRQ